MRITVEEWWAAPESARSAALAWVEEAIGPDFGGLRVFEIEVDEHDIVTAWVWDMEASMTRELEPAPLCWKAKAPFPLREWWDQRASV